MPDELGAAMGRNANKQRFYLGSDSSVSVWGCLSQNGSISKYNFSRYRRLKTLSEGNTHFRQTETHTCTQHYPEAGVHAYPQHAQSYGDTRTHTHTHRQVDSGIVFLLNNLIRRQILKAAYWTQEKKAKDA